MGSLKGNRSGAHSFGLPLKTVFMTAIFGLMGAGGALYISLLFFTIATPTMTNYIMYRPLHDSMTSVAGGLGFLGGPISSLARISDALVFASLAVLLALILVFDLARAKRGFEPEGKAAVKGPPLPLAAVVAVYLLPGLVMALKGFGEAIFLPGVLYLYIVLMSFSLFFRMSTREYSSARFNSPAKYTLLMVMSGVLFIVVVYLMSNMVVGEQFSGGRLNDTALGLRALLIVVLPSLLFMLMGGGGALSVLAGQEKGLGRAAIRGLVAGALVAAAMIAVNHVMQTYFFRALFEILGDGGEPTILGHQRMTLAMVLAMGLPLGVAGGSYMAMLPEDPGRGPRFLSLAAPIALLVVIGYTGVAFAKQCATVWGMDKASLNQAAGLLELPGPPRPRIALKLVDASGVAGDRVKLRREVYSFTAKSDLDLVYENIGRLNRYLADVRGRYAYYKNLAMEARRTIAGANWLVEEFREFCLQNSLDRGSILNTVMLLNSLTHAPKIPGNLEILRTLSDEKLFYVNGRSCLRMARAWAAMGDLKMAEKFYGCAKESLRREDLKQFDLPGAAGITSGVATGRIAGDAARSARVGLIHIGKGKLKDVTMNMWTAYRIKAAHDLAPGGGFSFENLPEGRYFVGLLLRSGVEGPFDIAGGRIFVIDRESPAVDLGEIRVSKSPPGPKIEHGKSRAKVPRAR